VAATRPIANNGLGLAVDNVKRKLERAESFFELLPDTPAIYREWLRQQGSENRDKNEP